MNFHPLIPPQAGIQGHAVAPFDLAPDPRFREAEWIMSRPACAGTSGGVFEAPE
jgi:hypothetical protein